jgi:flavin reductase (DIM6/NTAB) family NADH-FMN oxidoreductase RutF
MDKTVKSDIAPFCFHYPAGATIVTSHTHGRDNAMAVAWHTAVSREPPLYTVSISPRRFTHGLIVESGEFVVNFMPYENGELVALVAGCSGREVDKFLSFQITASPGSRVKAPVLGDAFAAYECRVVGRHSYGDHDLFVGEIQAVHWKESAFTPDGRLDLEQVDPIVYYGADRYSTTARLVHLDAKALARESLERAPEDS